MSAGSTIMPIRCRILTCLENPYPDFDGLNLSWETLEGLAKHNGPVATPSWALAEANAGFELELDAGRAWKLRSRRSPTTSPMTITTSMMGCGRASSIWMR